MTADPEAGLTRRAMLALLGGGAATVLVGGTVALRARDDGDGGGETGEPPPDPLPDSQARLDGIAQVGTRYRELVPEEATREALLAAIPMAEQLPDTAGALEGELGERREQIRSDFANGDVVDVDGWQLSVTEARLAALISLES